jgi:hypothetical protein
VSSWRIAPKHGRTLDVKIRGFLSDGAREVRFERGAAG